MKEFRMLRHLRLTGQNRLARPGMLVVVAVAGFDEGKAGKGSVGEVGEEDGQRGDVVRIDAEGICCVAQLRWMAA